MGVVKLHYFAIELLKSLVFFQLLSWLFNN